MSPTIFNVVVNVVAIQWVYVMVEGAGDQGRRGQEGRHQNYIFYMYDVMISLSDAGWLQGAFSTLVGLFIRVGLHTNVGNKV